MADTPATAMGPLEFTDGGEQIVIPFSNVREDPNTHHTVVDATLAHTDVYSGLTPDTVKDVLGTSKGTGTRKGLVFVSSGGTPTQPANGSYALTGGPPAAGDISDGQGGSAFSVTTRSTDAESANTTVDISAADD